MSSSYERAKHDWEHPTGGKTFLLLIFLLVLLLVSALPIMAVKNDMAREAKCAALNGQIYKREKPVCIINPVIVPLDKL